jgi:hypothetical protein
MNDGTMDPRFERDLRALLASSEPADVPATLRFFVEDVATRRSHRRLQLGRSWRTWAMAAGLAVAVLLFAVVGAGLPRLLALPLGMPAVGGLSPVPTFPTSIHGVWINFATARPLTVAEQKTLAGVLMDRMRAYGVDMEVSSVSSDRFDRMTADIGLVDGDQATIDGLRALLGATGRIEVVPLGDGGATAGRRLDDPQLQPLFANDGIAAATIGNNHPADGLTVDTIDLELSPQATMLFAEYTRDHIGGSFAIVVDGTVLAAPLIQDEIRDGRFVVSGGGFALDDARRLVAFVASGPLPVQIEEVSTVLR